MKRWLGISGLGILVLGSLAACADIERESSAYEKGLRAYEERDYETAFREFSDAAEQGDAKAQFHLGVMYEEGRGVFQNYRESRKRWLKATARSRDVAEQGDVDAQFLLGEIFNWIEIWGPDDTRKEMRDRYRDIIELAGKDLRDINLDNLALKWWRMAAERGHATAVLRIGQAYSGQFREADFPQVPEEGDFKWVRMAAEQGDAGVQYYLGCLYGAGGAPVKAAYWTRKAMKQYREAAERGDAKAQHQLGTIYGLGQCVARDFVLAAKWHRKAADQGVQSWDTFHWAYHNYLDEEYGSTHSEMVEAWGEAVERWHDAAEQGDADAQYWLGEIYERGMGVKKDEAEASKWYRKAFERRREAVEHEQSDADARYWLGRLYYEGKGVEEDDAKAAEWFLKAADQGHADAQYRLGRLYELQYDDGTGIEENPKKAAQWFRKAVDQGHARAQYALGRLYDYGDGVEENPKKANRLRRDAADQGHGWADFNFTSH